MFILDPGAFELPRADRREPVPERRERFLAAVEQQHAGFQFVQEA